MNRNFAIAITVAMFSGAAMAGGFNSPNATAYGGQGGAGGNSSALAVGTAHSNATATAGASAFNRTTVRTNVDASSRQGQGQIQGQGQSMTYNESKQDYSNTYEDYTPSVAAPSMGVSAPCYVPVSVGVGIPGVVASGGTAYEDEACTRRELIRIGLQSGEANAMGKAAALLNRELDAALAENEESETVASGSRDTSTGVFALNNN